jgi:hypothetical protein
MRNLMPYQKTSNHVNRDDNTAYSILLLLCRSYLRHVTIDYLLIQDRQLIQLTMQ